MTTPYVPPDRVHFTWDVRHDPALAVESGDVVVDGGVSAVGGSVLIDAVACERNVPVRLRLATDVCLPAGAPGRWPAILGRTPYDKLGPSLVLSARCFASHGDAVVLQDVRGRYVSEGEWYPFGHEGPDGVETIAWVRAQPWCDGRAATIGLSYSPCTQTSLAAQFVSQGFHNYHTASMRQGGAFEMRFFLYALIMALTSREAMADPATRAAMQQAWAEVRSWLRCTPPKAGLTPLRHVPSYERWLLDAWQDGDYDAYWSSRPGYLDRRPLRSARGCADLPLRGLVRLLRPVHRRQLRRAEQAQTRAGSPRHSAVGPRRRQPRPLLCRRRRVQAGRAARLRLPAAVVRRRAQGARTGVLETPRVQIFVMGGGSDRRLPGSGRLHLGGRWQDEREWPLAPPSPRRSTCSPRAA